MTYNADAVLESEQVILQHTDRLVQDEELREPADTFVHEIEPDGKKHNETEYFSEFYTKKPIRSMVINDRYLDKKEKILNRLGAHIDLAQQKGSLEWVLVKTQQSNDEQKQAIQQLKSHFPHLRIKFELDRRIDHDRYIEVTHVDGSKARVIIGVGLDFIEPTGHVRNTFLIFQTSYTK